jgi:hypothetical protein
MRDQETVLKITCSAFSGILAIIVMRVYRKSYHPLSLNALIQPAVNYSFPPEPSNQPCCPKNLQIPTSMSSSEATSGHNIEYDNIDECTMERIRLIDASARPVESDGKKKWWALLEDSTEKEIRKELWNSIPSLRRLRIVIGSFILLGLPITLWFYLSMVSQTGNTSPEFANDWAPWFASNIQLVSAIFLQSNTDKSNSLIS